MNVRSVAICAGGLLLLGWGIASADSVTWISGSLPLKEWSIDPAHPTPTDVIQFSGPTTVYSNSCLGERSLGGTPQLLIDTKAKVITLWFKGPVPQVCTMIYSPVAGLKGDFGPLPAGDWTFTCPSRDVGFEIHFTVQEKFAFHVDADAPGPIHDGRTWATAMLTLQDALAVASSGAEILMAEGVYQPDQGGGATAGSREATFMLKPGVTIRGGFPGYGLPQPDARNPAAYVTILSGDLKSDDQWGNLNLTDNSYHVVTGPADGLPALLDGVTITGGNADGTYPNHYGGGLYNPDGKLQAINCTFRANTGVWGGALMNFGPSVVLVNCQLIGNRALMLGGGLYNYEGAATLTNCRLTGNTAEYAETTGGAAIYNLNGNLTVLDCTSADNDSPTGRAIASFSWAPGVKVKVANSILYNGGNELWSNVREAVEVTYSDVQGGWTGAGNISTDPQFTRLGTRNLEGEWIDGDYRLKTGSPAIDAGSNAALPADSLDSNADGNVTESLPSDLDQEARVEGTRVDMGAYEQPGQKPTPTPAVDLTVMVGDSYVTLHPDPSASSSSNAFSATVDVDIELDFRGKLTVVATATSAAEGKWTAWVEPDIIGPGPATVTLTIKVENLNLAALPGGAQNVQVAEVEFFVAPL
ncbi:MAG: right-handed parallel beta-helix repeat-containing protein [Planctomycetes bacterium]|nr:right-handed parallel beta-helix repeat-containing protein [Planctomycetota bacterium]